jgi:hypothetical protein
LESLKNLESLRNLESLKNLNNWNKKTETDKIEKYYR